MEKIIRLGRDFMFTTIFNQERNVSKLERFISVYFEIPYENVAGKLKLIPRKLNKNKKREARKEVDLLLELKENTLKINIEINSSKAKGIKKRNTIYLCRISADNYKQGDKSYNNIWSSRQINFNIDGGERRLIEEYVLKEKESGEILTDVIQIDEINMAKTEEVCYNLLNVKEKMVYNFCKLLKTESKEEFGKVSELIMDKEESKDLIEQVDELSKDDEYVYWESDYSSEELIRNTEIEEAKEEGYEEGIEQGIEQGKEETIKETVINMLKMNINIDTISKVTNLSIDEINKIKL